jgi:hypothetical protein
MIYAISSVQLAKTGQMHLDQSYSGLQQQELSDENGRRASVDGELR